LANVSVTGGEIIAEGIKWNNSRYFGGEGSSFISTLNSAYAMNLFSEDGQVVDIQGTVYATNRNDSGVLGGLNILTFGNLSINGLGALHLGQLIYAPDDSFAPLMIDLSELSLAKKLSTGGDVYLRNDIKLGAFGDWSRVGSYSLYLCDALECDTTDTFDRSTPRSISLGKVTPYTQEALVTVRGGGSVDMELANPKSRLSSISVDDGATLTMRRGFTAESLHLGENAKEKHIPYNLRDCIAYEKALLLNPGDGDIRFNLELAQSKTVDKVIPKSEMFFVLWAKSFTNAMSEKGWSKIGITAFTRLISPPVSKSAPRAFCAFIMRAVSSDKIGINRSAIDIISASSCTGKRISFNG
jgi:hypothetical protein